MTKFCDGCPIGYQATGEINAIVSGEITYVVRAVMGKGALLDDFNGTAGVLVDDNNKPSLPMKFPGNHESKALERYTEKIDSCDGPIIEVRGLFRKKRYITGCSALGSVAIRNPTIKNRILRAAQIELM